MKRLFFLLLFRLIFAQDDETQLSSDKEKRLLDDIFKNYNKNILPPHNATQPVVIHTGMTAILLKSLDFAEQTLNIESWLKLTWHDKRLQWDERHYNNISIVRLDVNRLWRPDITILNSADSNMIEFAERSNTKHVLIYPDGLTVWIPGQTLKVLCALDITYYPFDTHNCSIEVGSWKSDVDFQIYEDKRIIDVSDLWYTEWEILDTYAERTTGKYDVLSDDNSNVHMTFSLKIRRARPLYHVVILFPLASGIMLAITAFLVSPFDNKRIGLNVFVLFLFTFIMFQLINMFPSVGRQTLAVASICETLIILIALSIAWNVILLLVFGFLARTKLTPTAQKFLNSWPIKFINQLYKNDTSQINVNSMKANGEAETETIILEQSESVNEWQHFFLVLDKLALIAFIFVIVVILFTFCC